ncbi:MAG: sulfotransferase [Acidobacteriota bacterium]|nr:sulfotransferase [Acidobacteriota bacterium]
MFWTRLKSQLAHGRAPNSKAQLEHNSLIPSPFVVGVGRSGTTLLRLMLDAHPDLAIPPETHFIPAAALAHKRTLTPRRAFLKTLTSHPMWQDHGIEVDLLDKRISTIKPFDLSEALRAFYQLYAERHAKTRWGDKTPFYVRRMKLIQNLLPEARFVHIIRDGRDVALSNRGLWFGPNSIEEAAELWVSWIEEARDQSRHLSHYLEIRYEDLLMDTETSLQRISEFIALPWNSAMLDYHKTAEQRMQEMHRDLRWQGGAQTIHAESRKAIHSLTSKPPQHDRIRRWQNEMTDTERECYERIAGRMLRELNYDVST